MKPRRPQPYRVPTPPDEHEPDAAPTAVADLGSLRSTHAMPLLAAPWARRARIALHVGGLVFRTATAERAIAFDDIDELWFELAGGGDVVSVALVTHDRARFEIPASLERSADLFLALDRRCSEPLRRRAFEAVVRGEHLTFDELGLDAEGIGGPGWALRWDQVSLVRVIDGQLVVFRGEGLLPSHAVRFDEVPHPGIFWALVKKLAPATEGDDSLGFLRPPE